MTSTNTPDVAETLIQFMQAHSPNDSGTTAPLGSPVQAAPLPELKISRPLKIPSFVSSNCKQHIVIARDPRHQWRVTKSTSLI